MERFEMSLSIVDSAAKYGWRLHIISSTFVSYYKYSPAGAEYRVTVVYYAEDNDRVKSAYGIIRDEQDRLISSKSLSGVMAHTHIENFFANYANVDKSLTTVTLSAKIEV
jgi:hypothetical protein